MGKIHKPGKGGKAIAADPLRGFFSLAPADGERAGVRGKPELTVEYESDPDLRDTEQIPFLEAPPSGSPGGLPSEATAKEGIETFIRREVLPYTPDAWIKEDATKIGYEISFTRHFYQPQPLRTLEEIRADIITVEKAAKGVLDELFKGGTK
jgi:type I restriction enzyme M protein